MIAARLASQTGLTTEQAAQAAGWLSEGYDSHPVEGLMSDARRRGWKLTRERAVEIVRTWEQETLGWPR
jgi:hypothetical protein